MNLTREDLREIKRKRQALEASMEGEIDSLLTTRRNARVRLQDDLQSVHTCGMGRRTLNARMGYRKQTVWGKPVKARFGALD